MNNRLIKILFACTVALYMSLVCLNNLIDYNSNFAFLSMVAKMDDTFSTEKNGLRSIHSEVLHHLFFAVIILWEAIIAICLVVGASNMIRKFHATTLEFRNAKSFV